MGKRRPLPKNKMAPTGSPGPESVALVRQQSGEEHQERDAALSGPTRSPFSSSALITDYFPSVAHGLSTQGEVRGPQRPAFCSPLGLGGNKITTVAQIYSEQLESVGPDPVCGDIFKCSILDAGLSPGAFGTGSNPDPIGPFHVQLSSPQSPVSPGPSFPALLEPGGSSGIASSSSKGGPTALSTPSPPLSTLLLTLEAQIEHTLASSPFLYFQVGKGGEGIQDTGGFVACYWDAG